MNMPYSCKFSSINSDQQGRTVYFSVASEPSNWIIAEQIIEDCTFESCSGTDGGSIYISQI